MIAELSLELQEALHSHGGGPFRLVDPATSTQYVLISKDLYDRLRPVFDDEPLSDLEQQQLIREAGRRAGWDDPEMDAYDDYDEHRSKPT